MHGAFLTLTQPFPIKVPEFIRYFAKVQFHRYANVVLKYTNLPEAATGSLKLNYFYPPS